MKDAENIVLMSDGVYVSNGKFVKGFKRIKKVDFSSPEFDKYLSKDIAIEFPEQYSKINGGTVLNLMSQAKAIFDLPQVEDGSVLQMFVFKDEQNNDYTYLPKQIVSKNNRLLGDDDILEKTTEENYLAGHFYFVKPGGNLNQFSIDELPTHHLFVFNNFDKNFTLNSFYALNYIDGLGKIENIDIEEALKYIGLPTMKNSSSVEIEGGDFGLENLVQRKVSLYNGQFKFKPVELKDIEYHENAKFKDEDNKTSENEENVKSDIDKTFDNKPETVEETKQEETKTFVEKGDLKSDTSEKPASTSFASDNEVLSEKEPIVSNNDSEEVEVEPKKETGLVDSEEFEKHKQDVLAKKLSGKFEDKKDVTSDEVTDTQDDADTKVDDQKTLSIEEIMRVADKSKRESADKKVNDSQEKVHDITAPTDKKIVEDLTSEQHDILSADGSSAVSDDVDEQSTSDEYVPSSMKGKDFATTTSEEIKTLEEAKTKLGFLNSGTNKK